MRCVEVIRELAVPGGHLDPADLARHLASCPSCAAKAEGFERLNRAWEATRPAEPPASAFDALWARVSRAADAPAARPAIVAMPRRPAWRLALLGLAAAAALLLAMPTLPWFGRYDRHATAATLSELTGWKQGDTIAVLDKDHEVEEGRTLVLCLNLDDQLKDVMVADFRADLEEGPSDAVTVASNYELFNGIESLASMAQ
jgi:hypothetical protein